MDYYFHQPVSRQSIVDEIENKELLYISYDDKIPSSGRGLSVSIGFDEYGHISIDKENKPDPSTIFVKLPVKKPNGFVPELNYYPNYIDLTPEQRYIYLNWLRNVDNEIDMGYVFLYYYGLERQLLVGNFEKAFDQIIRLRNNHRNKSFQSYSEKALIHSCIMRDKIDLLLFLNEKTDISGFSNTQFLLALNNNFNLGAENLILIFKKHIKLASKPIKEDIQLLLDKTKEALVFKYGNDTFPFSGVFDFSKLKNTTETRFANYSFPIEIQKVKLSNFYTFKPLMAEVESIFDIAYDAYKKEKATKRKLEKTDLSESEIIEKQVRADIRRYEKLLNDKKINQTEFEILKKYTESKITINEDNTTEIFGTIVKI